MKKKFEYIFYFSLILILLFLFFISAITITHNLASNWTGTFVNTTITGNNVTLNISTDWGAYTGISYDISSQENTPTGIAGNGTNFFVVGTGTGGNVSVYNLDWTYTGITYNIGVQDFLPNGIAWNGVNWFVSGDATNVVPEYTSAWVYTGGSYQPQNLRNYDGYLSGIAWNGTNFFIAGIATDRIYVLTSSFADVTNYSIAAQDGTPRGISWDGTYWWMVGDDTNTIYKYYSNWTYTGTSYNVSAQDTSPQGIFWDGTNWYLVGDQNNKVYKYNSLYPSSGTYTSQVIDAGSSVQWNNLSWTNWSYGQNITFQLSSCDDASCSGETLVGSDNTSSTYFTSSPATLNTTITPNNQYFQYKAFFLTGNTSLTPHLASVSVDYTVLDTTNPQLTINYPINYSNFSTLNVNVNFTIIDTNLQTCWYSNNSGATNNTFTCVSNITGVDWEEGTNVVYVYANDTLGNTNNSELVSFSVDTLAPNITLISPADAYSTTSPSIDFEYNVTDDFSTNCSLILDGAEVSTNSSVNITGGTTAFSQTGLSVASHTWSINCTDYVNNQANSSTRTFAIASVPITPSGGGGGGGATISVDNFNLDKDLFHIKLKQGETKRETLTIKNNLNKNLTININSSELTNFLMINEEFFTVLPKESKIINLDFFTKDDEIPDVYLGRIAVKDETTQKTINVIIEIKERVPLFDLRVDVSNKKLLAGDEIKFKMLTINQGDLTGFDILMHYSIKDFEGNIYEFKEESIKIDRELMVDRGLIIPKNLTLGKYILYSKISYGNITATGIDTFEVMGKNGLMMYKILIVGIIFSIIIITAVLLIVLSKK